MVRWLNSKEKTAKSRLECLDPRTGSKPLACFKGAATGNSQGPGTNHDFATLAYLDSVR